MKGRQGNLRKHVEGGVFTPLFEGQIPTRAVTMGLREATAD